LGVRLALLGLALGLGLLVIGDLAEALLGLAAPLVLRVLERLVSTHRQPPGSRLRTGPVQYGEARAAAREDADLPVGTGPGAALPAGAGPGHGTNGATRRALTSAAPSTGSCPRPGPCPPGGPRGGA